MKKIRKYIAYGYDRNGRYLSYSYNNRTQARTIAKRLGLRVKSKTTKR